MSVDWRDIAVRAIKTFVQAFLATVAVGLATATTVDSLQVLAVAGLAAGISAVQNWIRDTL